MIDLYEIGVDLILSSEIDDRLDSVIRGFGVLQEAIEKTNASLGLTATAVADVARASRGMAGSWNKAADAAERMAAATDKIHDGMPPGGGGGDGDTDRSPRPNGNNGSGDNHHVSPWDFIIAGGIALKAGESVVTKPYDEAATIQHQAVLMQNQGATPQEMQQAVDASQKLQQWLPGLSQEDAMTIIRDTFSQSINPDGSRNMGEAITVASQMAQTAYVLQGLGDDDAASAMFSLLRAGDLRGLMNTRNGDGSVNFGPIEKFIAGYQAMAQASGGRITPQDYQTILKGAGPEGLMMDDHALEEAAILSGTMGPSAVGVGINALAQQFIGGKMSEGAAQRLHKAGLLPDYMFDKDGKVDKLYHNGTMGQVMLPNGAVTKADEFGADPFKWIQDVYEPAAEKLNPGDRASLLNDIYAEMSKIPGARAAAEALFQQGFLDRQLSGLAAIPGQAQSVANVKNDPTNTSAGFFNAVDAFLAQLGTDALPTTTAQLKDLTAALNGLTNWAKDHPNAGSDLAMTGQTVAEAGGTALLYGAARLIMKTLGGGVAGAGAKVGAGVIEGESTAIVAAEGAAFAAGPPGWMVALAAAVVVELFNTKALNSLNYAGVSGGPTASRQNAITPTGTPNDPVHVKLYALAPNTTWMPSAPTGGSTPHAKPNPGQVYSP